MKVKLVGKEQEESVTPQITSCLSECSIKYDKSYKKPGISDAEVRLFRCFKLLFGQDLFLIRGGLFPKS